MERDTSQRRAIRRIFEEVGRPLSPQEVLEAAQSHAASLGIATVYRNLKALVEAGWLVPVGLPGEPDRYEMAGKDHHHHFRCRSCERVYEVESCPGNIHNMVPAGFLLEDHEVVLYGVCASCAGT